MSATFGCWARALCVMSRQTLRLRAMVDECAAWYDRHFNPEAICRGEYLNPETLNLTSLRQVGLVTVYRNLP